MDDLLQSSISGGSTTSTDYSNDKDIKVKQDDSMRVDSSNLAVSKGTKHPVSTSSRREDYKISETRVLEFEDSQAVRNAVYQQWLLEKKAKIKEKRIKETKNQSLLQDEEAKTIAKKEQLKADAVRAYEKWKMKKDRDLEKKTKTMQQEREKEEEATKAKDKQQQAEQVIAAWQKKKDENLKSFLIGQAKKCEEEKQRLKQEAEKKAISKLAFDKWMEKKRKVLSETQKSQKSYDHMKEQNNNNTESKTMAFEEWKRKKDEQIKLQNSTRKVEHKQPWRPARSIKYDYLKSPQPLPNERSKNDSISSSSTNSLSASQSSIKPEIKPKLKSVKVCCQTLEYWCICQKIN